MNFENPALCNVPDKHRDNANKYHQLLGATLSTVSSLDDGQSLIVVATHNYEDFCLSWGFDQTKVRTPLPKSEVLILTNGHRVSQCNGTKPISFLRTEEGIILFVPPSLDYAHHILELAKDYLVSSFDFGYRNVKFSLSKPTLRYTPFGYDEIDPNRKTVIVLGNNQQVCKCILLFVKLYLLKCLL